MSTEFDAIVVGSGISGGWAAKELCERGLKTLLIERGRHIEHGGPEYTDMITPWESKHYGCPPERFVAQNPRLASVMQFALNPDNLHWFVNDSEQPYSTPDDKPFVWIRSYNLGGRSVEWWRHAHRMGEFHFNANKTDGHGVAWPIGYDDLAPWYDYVESFVGIAGSIEGLEHFPDGKFQPPFELNCAERVLKEQVEAAFPGRKVIPARTANLTAPTAEQRALGRSQCQSRLYCYKGCSFGAYFCSLSATLPAARRTGNLTIMTDSIAHSVVYDPPQKRATGVRVVDAKTKEGREYKARIIFLCASTLPTTQILLLSASEAFPNGLANRSGALGRYLMDTMSVGGAGTLPGHEDRYYYGRKPNGYQIPAYRNVTELGGEYLRSFGLQGEAVRTSWERGAERAGIGASAKAALRTPGPWKMSMSAFGEMIPRWRNNVTLHPTKTDRWGMPLVHIDLEYSDNERRMMAQAKTDIREMLQAAGCVDIAVNSLGKTPGLTQEAGTAVMGSDPLKSVLNRWNQAHDVQNLFITDGSCMASHEDNGGPSLTYMALTARAVDHAVELLREGKL